MSITAAKFSGVRPALVWDDYTAKMSRAHNDANILVLPARCLSDDEGVAILKAWLDTPFEGGRHSRRVAKIETDTP